jgi:D-sedoheptulose 7-phosphate isomerase
MRLEPHSNSWAGELAALLDAAEATDRQGRPMPQTEAFDAAEAMILAARSRARKVMVVGNGGSAAIASHLQTDLAHSLGVRALIFTEPSILTAQANDHGYQHAFANLVDLWADPEDLLVAISSSGRSANILGACARARARGAGLLTFSGFSLDNPLRSLGDLNFHVASPRFGPVESAHAVLLHHLTDQILATLSSEVHR